MDLSAGLNLLGQIAIAEAQYNGRGSIGKEEFTIGLLSLEAVLSQLDDPQQVVDIAAEAIVVEEALKRAGCDSASLREEIRRIVGTQSQSGQSSRIVAIREDAQGFFPGADKLARSHQLPGASAVHFLQAIFEDPSEEIRLGIEQVGSSVEKLIAVLSELGGRPAFTSLSPDDAILGWHSVQSVSHQEGGQSTNWWAESGYELGLVLVSLGTSADELRFDARTLILLNDSGDAIQPSGIIPLITAPSERFSVIATRRLSSEGLNGARPIRFGLFFIIPSSYGTLTLWSSFRPSVRLVPMPDILQCPSPDLGGSMRIVADGFLTINGPQPPPFTHAIQQGNQRIRGWIE